MSDEQLIATPGVFGETGNFLLERELGRGGMGGVYMGRDKMLDRPVAVKVMLREYGSDLEFVEKFKREAQAAARLIHPNIAQIYSYGIADGMPYIAMELVAGGSLWSIMQNAPGRTDITRVMKIGEQVAQALRCAADQGLVHGDIKPENILLDANGNAKIVDFGLAAMQKDTDEIWGTPYYIAPEKIRKEVVDFRADMYNLGGTLYHALTGVAPFEGPDATAVVKARFAGAPKKPSEIRPEISAKIDSLVMRMLAYEKADRFPSFEALLEEFKNVMASGLTAAPEKPAQSSSGGKKVVLTKKPKLKVRRPKAFAEEEEEEQPKNGRGGRKRRYIENDEGGESDGGGKLVLTVFCVIAAIVLVIGGLVWYQIADKRARAAAEHANVLAKLEEGRDAVAATRKAANSFIAEIEQIAGEAVAICQKPTDELIKALPEDVSALLKFEPTAELREAIALTNEVAEAESETADGEKQAKKISTNETEKVVTVYSESGEATTKVVKERRARRVIEEYDPADPDYKPPEEQIKDADSAEAAQAAEAAAAEPPKEIPAIVKDMNELWSRAYGCQAASIRVCHKVRQLLQKMDEIGKMNAEDEETARLIGSKSQDYVDEFSKIKSDPDVETVRKAGKYIKSRGETLVKRELNRIRVEKLEAERAEQKRLEAEAEAKRAAEREAAHKKLIEEEVAAAKKKYEDLITQGTLRSLSWDVAVRQLSNMKRDSQTAEGGIAAGLELRKVQAMKLVHDTIITNLTDYTFTKSKLKGYKVLKVDATEVKFLKPDGKNFQKLLWTKIYADFHGNLNELINRYIEKGRVNAKLSIKDWCEAMMGAALTMRVICSDDVAAPVRGEQIAKRAIAEFPEHQKLAEEFFPDIDFNSIEKADNL